MKPRNGFAVLLSGLLHAFAGAALAQPANDDIGDAIDLFGDPINVTGTTSGATDDVADAGTSSCGTSITAGGVWYRVYGVGGAITADTCGAGTSYDTKLSVFSGAPGSLVCITGNDDTCGLSSAINWSAAPGEAYYLLVHGFGSGQGDFELDIVGAGDGPLQAVPVLPGWALLGLASLLLGFGGYRARRGK